MENLDDIVCSLSECLKINKKNQRREREKKKIPQAVSTENQSVDGVKKFDWRTSYIYTGAVN